MADIVPDLDALAGDPTSARHTHLGPTSPKKRAPPLFPAHAR
jgi:hypothetical protein